MIDIEKLENLPKKESITDSLINKYGNLYNLHKWDSPYSRIKYDNKCIWKYTHRVLENSIGKPFDLIFSKYCKVVRFNRDEFLDNFRGFRRWGSNYIVDEKGLIQKNPNGFSSRYKTKKEQKVTFYSFDYEEGYYNPISKQILTEKEYKNKYWICENTIWKRIVIKGFWKEFDSIKDKEYIRLISEKRKQKILYNKKLKKYNKEKAYSFLTRSEQQLIKEKELDLIKRDSHGFDENSFKYDPYHGGK